MRPLGLPRVKLCPRLSVTGAAACKTLGKGTGEARQAPRARGERRRHTITNGVDCSLVRGARTLRDSVLSRRLETRENPWAWLLGESL